MQPLLTCAIMFVIYYNLQLAIDLSSKLLVVYISSYFLGLFTRLHIEHLDYNFVWSVQILADHVK
jgi:hypothetical protein